MIRFLTFFAVATAFSTTLEPRSVGMHYSIFGNTLEANNGQYKIKRIIGGGTYGVVYLASPISPLVGDDIAIKIIRLPPKSYCLPWKLCSLSSKNIKIEDQAVNPYICEVSALDRLGLLVTEPIINPDGSKLYIPMNYTKGNNVHTFLKSKGPRAMLYVKKAFLAAQIALSDLHKKGIAHHDCHMNNFLILELESGNIQVTWIDFGWAKFDPESGVSPAQCQMNPDNVEKAFLLDRLLFRSQFYLNICLKYLPGDPTMLECFS